jgi:CYTH domain-containing protein
MEIERKWLFNIKEVPIGLSNTLTHYKQAYISVEPEVRIRSKSVESAVYDKRKSESYALCIKGNGSLARHEIQRSITKEEFEALKEIGNINDEMFIRKHYYTIPIGTYDLTVGVVDERSSSEFCYGEIEFESETEALQFQPPFWFGKEITDDSNYKMKNYWKRTRLGINNNLEEAIMNEIEVKCKGCNKKPDEISEYNEMVEAGDYKTAEEAVRCEEGTFNSKTGAFYCTSCYIEAGCPLGKA